VTLRVRDLRLPPFGVKEMRIVVRSLRLRLRIALPRRDGMVGGFVGAIVRRVYDLAIVVDALARAKKVVPLALLCLAAMPATSHAAEAIVGVTAGASPEMVRFDSSSPGTIVARAPVTGLIAGETVSAIDQRPATGEIFALTSTNRVLRLDPQDGTMTSLGAMAGTFGATASAGLDFNPAADRLRAVNPANDNARFNPVTSTFVQDDTDLAYIATDVNVGVDPSVVASAYDRNDNDGATASTLFAIDSSLNNLVRQGAIDGNAADAAGGGSPNGGLLTSLGGLGFDPTTDVAFDVATAAVGGANVGYLATHTNGAGDFSELRTINLPGTAPVGATTSLGTIGANTLSGMTVLQGGSVRVAGPSTIVGEEDAQAVVHVERVGDTLAPIQLTYETADRSALSGLDYVSTTGFLNFATGESSQDVAIPLLGDSEFEGAEVFDLEFGPPGPGAVLDTSSHPIAISDDDVPPVAPAGPPGPPGPPATVALDRLAPAFLSVVRTPKSLAALRKAKRLNIEFVCSEQCVVSFSLRLGKTKLGSGVSALSRAGSRKAVVKLTVAARKVLGKIKKRRTSLSLESTAIDPAGNSAKRRINFSLPRR
jgi:hypothetical protein